MITVVGFGSFVILLGAMPSSAVQESAPWDAEISAFEVQDRAHPPPRDGIVFVGSSSIRMWDLAASFPNLPVINRGFGGSQLADSVLYAGRIVVPYHPRLVVLYAGDNDIAAGKTPRQVAHDFAGFVKVVRAGLPKVTIIFLSIKPSPQRWDFYDRMQEANALIREQIKRGRNLRYLDVGTPLLGKDGKPRADLFQADGLHLNAEGYAVWTGILRKPLKS